MDRALHIGMKWLRVRQLGRRIVGAGLDLVLPPRCGGCGAVGMRWCDGCRASLLLLKPPICPHCGYPQSDTNVCSVCRGRPTALSAVRSAAFFEGPLRGAIHRLKYRRDLSLAEALSDHLVHIVGQLPENPEVIVPVPLAPARFAERGYNQAALLAADLGRRVRLTVDLQSLIRIRETPSQTKLNARERLANVDGAFAVHPSGGLRGLRALLVDDVHTTGATLEACAAALRDAGAAGVAAVTLGRARRTMTGDEIRD